MRLVLAFLSLTSLCVFAAAAQAGEKSGNSRATTAAVPSGPPEAEIKPVADIFHGTRVIDNYRWLEKADSPATMKWVAEENAYTRAILDPLPRREAIHQRLRELLSIGNVTAPVIAGHHYFYTRREGMQNQPVLYVRDAGEGAHHAPR